MKRKVLSITLTALDNIILSVCPDHGTPIVAIRDNESEDGWMCMHCDDPEDDAHDVEEFRKDPTGKTCNWKNPTLQRLQREDNNYKIEPMFNLN